MAEKTVARALGFLKRQLNKCGLTGARVIVFGSRSRSGATVGSDLDVVIVSTRFRGLDLFARARLTRVAETQLIEKFGIPVDILTLTPAEYAGHPLFARRLSGRGKSAAA